MRDGQPLGANPGGSAFNSAVSLGRAGAETFFIGETGDDEAGKLVRNFLETNGVHSQYLMEYPGRKTALSLAFLDGNNDAHYSFYRDEPAEHKDFPVPDFGPGDMVVFGSFFAVAPALRAQLRDFLLKARGAGAIIYYDINFRPSHAKDLSVLRPYINENIALADIVRASGDDIRTAFGGTEPGCTRFIRTDGPGAILLRDGELHASYDVPPIETVSTIGAGDSFNAGVAFALMGLGVERSTLAAGIGRQAWDKVISTARDFSAACCKSLENYIPAIS